MASSSPFGNSPFSSNPQTRASSYAQTALKLAASHQAGHHSLVGGFISHLAGDVVNSAEGLPAGILHLATTNPVQSGKEIFAAEKKSWGPLFQGDYQTFVHNFYEHPLGPILDVAGVLTGGAGLAGKAGLLGKLGEGADRTLQVGSKVETVGRYSDNPVIRLRQRAFDQITKTMPKQTPLMGESARASRALARIADHSLAAKSHVGDVYTAAAHKLTKSYQHTAYMTLSNGQSPLELLRDTERQIETHNAKINTQLVKAEALHAKTTEDLMNHEKDLETHRAATEHVTNSKALMSQWEKEGNRLERQGTKLQKTHELASQRIEDLNGQIRSVEQVTKQVLSDPRAEKLFHDSQAAHKQLKKLGYDRAPEEFNPEGAAAAAARGKKLAKVRLGDVIGQVKMSKDVHNILTARDAARDAANLDGDIRKIPEDQREMRRYLHPLLRRGATFEPDKLALIENRTGELKLGEVQDGGKIKLVSKRGVGSVGARVAKEKIVKLSPLEGQKYLDELFPMDSPNVSRALYHKDGIDTLLAKVKQVHEATGRAEPVYFPDKMMIRSPSRTRERGNKFAKSAQTVTSVKNHQNLGALYMAGVINTDPLVLAQQTMADIMVAHAADIADLLRSHAEAYTGPGVPKGYVALKGQAVMRNYMNEKLPQFRREMAQHIADNNENGMVRSFIDNHFTNDALEMGDGHKLIVPKKFIDTIVPEFKKSSDFARAFYHRPQAIWKHIVLAGRPLPFITNNVVGNTVMYGLQHSGPEGVRALVRSHNEERAFEELAPEHHLTFGQAHAVKRPGRLGKSLNLAYHAVGTHEHLLRRAAFVAKARGMTEVRTALKDLKSSGYRASENDGKTILHAAIEKADKAHPGVTTQLGEHIDDVMGNYRRYSKSEEAIRSVMPFYSWSRHAARAYYRILTDKPLTGALITHIGDEGSARQQKLLGNVPDFMKQYLPAGALKALGYGTQKGHIPVINASVLNPESTVADEIKTVSALVSGNPGDAPSDLTSSLSPLITAPIEAATGKSLLTGAPIASNFASGHGALGASLGNVAVNLPIPKLLETLLPPGTPGSALRDPNNIHNLFTPTGKPKAQHQDTLSKDVMTQLLNTIFGVPAKNVNLKASQAWQKRIEDTKTASQFHVAKKRKSTRKSTSPFGVKTS